MAGLHKLDYGALPQEGKMKWRRFLRSKLICSEQEVERIDKRTEKEIQQAVTYETLLVQLESERIRDELCDAVAKLTDANYLKKQLDAELFYSMKAIILDKS